MGKDKKKGGAEKQAPSASHGSVSLETKRAWREAQSKRDREAARRAEGWAPSKKSKEATSMDHRCKTCLRPSAACRKGSGLCLRCSGAGKRDRSKDRRVTAAEVANAIAADAVKAAMAARGGA